MSTTSRSGLVSRFISLIFGELEKNGNFTYINAGHPPGLLRDRRGFTDLSVGGTLLGPQHDATYKLGFAHLDRGASLAIVTDGVLERGVEAGDMFGDVRLREWMDDHPVLSFGVWPLLVVSVLASFLASKTPGDLGPFPLEKGLVAWMRPTA